jgi:hypothetical protein
VVGWIVSYRAAVDGALALQVEPDSDDELGRSREARIESCGPTLREGQPNPPGVPAP